MNDKVEEQKKNNCTENDMLENNLLDNSQKPDDSIDNFKIQENYKKKLIQDDPTLLKQELKNTQELSEQFKNKWLLAVADKDNSVKRLNKELSDVRQFAVANFAKDVLEINDNLDRALKNSDDLNNTKKIKSLIEGLKLTSSELIRVMNKYNISKINPAGQKFDPNKHQATHQIPSDEAEKGTVLEVVQVGYKIGDRTLRPAMVGIASEKITTSDEN